MRISDWSSDVCSSDLPWRICPVPQFAPPRFAPLAEIDDAAVEQLLDRAFGADRHARTAYKVRDGTTPIAALSLALVEDGTLLGTIQCWPVVLSGDDGRAWPLVMVGPVAIDPPRQQPGRGHRLGEKILAAAAAIGAG